MKNSNIILEKTFAFAIRMVKLHGYLTQHQREFILSKQLLRAGTSIGANTEEAMGAHSNADFLAKLTIAYKEARESSYWLRLLHATQFLTDHQANSLLQDLESISKILGSIQTTLKQKR